MNASPWGAGHVNRTALSVFRNPEAIKIRVRELLNAAIIAWGRCGANTVYRKLG